MNATLKNNFKSAVTVMLIAIFTIWSNMKRSQKDRVGTLIVRSVENVIYQRGEPMTSQITLEENFDPPLTERA